MSRGSDGKYRVGVSGHIRLARGSEERLAMSLRELLKGLGTTKDVVGVSAGAEGADQLFLEVCSQLDLPCEMVLTCPEDEFVADFAREESLVNFRRYLGNAQAVYRPYLSHAEGAPNHYAIGDSALCRICDVMIVLWDGEPTQHPAGTARVVDLRLGQGAPPYCEGDHTGPVVQVVTTRESMHDGVGRVNWLGGNGGS